MKKWYETFLQQASGALRPAVGVSVAVYEVGTSNLAVIYEDDATTPKTNPLTTDANGYVEFRAPNGLYEALPTKNGVELHGRLEIDFTSNFDSTNVNITGGQVNGVTIGNVTRAVGKFTDLHHSGELHGGDA